MAQQAWQIMGEITEIIASFLECFVLVMVRDENLRELNVNVISRFTICVKGEIREWQFSLFIVIFREKHVIFSVILREITEITWIWREMEFTA